MDYDFLKKIGRSRRLRLGCGWQSKVIPCPPLSGVYQYLVCPPTMPVAEMIEFQVELPSHDNDHHASYIRRCKFVNVIALPGKEWKHLNNTFERTELNICDIGSSYARRRRALVNINFS